MEAFFKRVLLSVALTILTGKADATPEDAKKAIRGYIREAVNDATEDLKQVVAGIPDQLDKLEENALGNIDAMDGKIGNLQEQIVGIPGEVIKGVVDAFKGFNPLGGLFGQQ